jgi:hypothetical protein
MPRLSRNDIFRNETLAVLYGLRNTLDYRTFNAYNTRIRNMRIDAVRRIRTELTTQYIQNVIITYNYRELNDPMAVWRQRTVARPIQGLKKNLKRLAKERYEEYRANVEQESPIETANFSYTVEAPIAVIPVGVQNIPMARAKPYQLSGDVSQEWNTNKGKCVIDYLVHLWGQTKGLKKLMTEESLTKEFQEICDDYRKINEPEIDVLKSGITITFISNFCRKYNLTFYALAHNRECIEKFVDPKSRYKALIFRMLNGHIYPIENETQRKKVVEMMKEIDKRVIDGEIEQKKAEAKKKKQEIQVLYPSPYETDGNEYIIRQIKRFNKIPFPFNRENISYTDGRFNSVKIDDKFILADPIERENKNGDLEPTVQGLVKEYVEKNGEKYVGQNVVQLLQQFWTETYEEEIKYHSLQSKFNPIVYQYLNVENVKYRTHYGSTQVCKDKEKFVEWLENPDNEDNFQAVDIMKCYSSLLLKPLDNWLVYDILDDIEPYVETDGDFEFGLYVVETNDLTILHQSNIYSNKILDYARENGVEFKVKYQMIKRKKYNSDNLENRNHFHKIIDKIKSWDMDKRMMKLIINSITGYMGKTTNKKYDVKLNTNILEVFEDAVINGTAKSKEIYFEKMQDLFVYGSVVETEIVNNSLPIYIQILDWSNIKLHQMIKKIGGKCIYRHTDMALLVKMDGEVLTGSGADYPYDHQFNPDDDITETWGKTKEENPRSLRYKHYETYMNDKRHCVFPTLDDWKTTPLKSSNDYKEIIELAVKNGGLLVEGRAGTGKDYVISQGLPELDADCKLALTNKASNIMGGTTIHKALGINDNDKACAVMMKKYKHKKIIVVNEISMINKTLWYKLYLLKKQNPKLVFILLGDYRQCRPIEEERTDIKDFDYFTSSIVKYLSNYHKIELTERQRYDLEMWNMLEDYYEKGIIPNIPFGTAGLKSRKICYYNRTRKYINKLSMDASKTNDALFLDFDDDEDDPSKYKQQPVYIYNDLPVMSIKNNKDLGIVNGDEYFVQSFTNDTITFNNELTINKDKFHSNFVANYCATTHKLQGATIDEPLFIFDFDKLMSDRHLGYTAMSRVKNISQLYRM